MVRSKLAALTFVALSFFPAFAAPPARSNIVLITLDSTRADRMGFLGGKAGVTPNLDRLAAESLVFDHAYAQAPGTVVSHATIMTGAYPQSTGMSEIGGTLPTTLPYLPELLKAQGYKTAAFVGSIRLDPRNGLAQGFDRGFQNYDAGFRPVIAGDARPPVTERSADQVAAHAIAWLTKNGSAPFFLWIQLNDPHAPNSSYNAAITVADAAVGKVLNALKQQKIEANTAILVVADHGESLGSHGEDTHGMFLYDETIHVPLVLKPVGTSAAKRVPAKVRLVDVAPTLLEIAAVPVPSQMQGQSLLRVSKAATIADQPVYSRTEFPQRGFGWSPLESWRAGKYLYIRAPKPELYDLTVDPGATKNLAQSSKATVDTLASQLDGFDRRFNGEAGKPASAELSSAEMQKLASLGYVGLQKSAGSATAVAGTDPKDKIAIANKVLEAGDAASQGKSDRAIATLAPLVSAESSLYEAEYALGTALAQKGQSAEAIKHLHKAIEIQPDSAWAHYRMGAGLLKTGDFKTAAVHLEIAAGRLPEFPDAHLKLAEAYEKLGRTEDAKKERGKAK